MEIVGGGNAAAAAGGNALRKTMVPLPKMGAEEGAVARGIALPVEDSVDAADDPPHVNRTESPTADYYEEGERYITAVVAPRFVRR